MDKKISELTELVSLEADDLFEVAEKISEGVYTNKKVLFSNITPSGVIVNTGDQTIGGIKTFTSYPVLPSGVPSANFQSVPKQYVDDSISSISSGADMGTVWALNA